MAKEKELRAKLSLKDNFSKSIDIQIEKLNKFQKKADEVNKKVKELEKQKKIEKEMRIKLKSERVDKEVERLEKKFQGLKRKFIKPLLMKAHIQDKISEKIDKIKGKVKSLSKKPITIVTKIKDNISRKLEKIEAKAKFISKRFDKLKSKTLDIKDKISGKIEKIKSKLKSIEGIKKVVIKGKDMASGVISKIGSAIKGLVKIAAAVGAAIGLALAKGIKDAAMFEQQNISMEHFVSVNNPKMNIKEVQKKTSEYVKWLEKNANQTPFTTNEVMTAGSRAVGVAGGDLKKAKELVKLSEDMAALTPGKTIIDAMEALADADMGEMERLKEFSFKASKEDLDKVKGDLFKLKNNKGIGIMEMFSGGAEKFASSGAGLWSTIQGQIETMNKNVGAQLLEKIKPQLENVASYLETNGAEIGEKLSSGIANGLNKLTEIGQNLLPVITPVFDTLRSLGEQMAPVWESMKETFGTLFNSLVENAAPLLQQFIELITPLLQKLWNNILQPFFSWLAEQMPVIKSALATVLEWLAPKIEFIIDAVSRLGPVFSLAWDIITTAIEAAWNILNPIFDLIWDACTKLGEVFQTVFGKIAEVVSSAWDTVGPILTKLSKLLGDVVSGVGDFLSSGIDKVRNFFGGGGGSGKSSTSNKTKKKSTGIRNVPRDNYPALLHKGEAVVPARENRNKGTGNVNIAKLADQIVVREEADIDKIANELVSKIKETSFNMA
ncbi:hypothetical protein CLPU_22c00240 [Gottschalkia purinilytica]|uniref:Uncharacterized protein n=1 Tax=Gottschalkia purinilytica TaxID=1503 RepID=A0A0L0W6Q9_GOTPU|nr:hypothetical protein [Gottschalkia purinilytica]KNF07172.1 hypothetical protein CLPU_22c00240 [Gottschalkia purinilytica]